VTTKEEIFDPRTVSLYAVATEQSNSLETMGWGLDEEAIT
jgi:hypothetical protein